LLTSLNLSSLAQAKTGTGKTLAFLVPAMQNILNDATLRQDRRGRYCDPTDTRALIISPTRELAEQIAVEARKLAAGTRLQVRTAVGGSHKASGLRRIQQEGCHLLIGTPGRLKDILSDPRNGVEVPKLNTLILDEADRLLDDGFAPDIIEIQRMLPSPQEVARQTLMFSATVPREVMAMVRRTLKPGFKFVKTIRDDEVPTHLTVPQKSVVLRGYENALPAILELAKNYQAKQRADSSLRPFKAIVYFNSTAEVRLAAEAFSGLEDSNRRFHSPLGRMNIHELHSRLSQRERTMNAESFRRSSEAILFSSDVSARGMDFPNVTHVIQIGIPQTRETYVHRLGRTARAGKTGEGWLFLHDAQFDNFQEILGDLPLTEDSTSLPAASARMSPFKETASVEDGDALAGTRDETSESINQVQKAMASIPARLREDAFQPLMSSLKGSIHSKRRLLKIASDAATIGWSLPEAPAVTANFAQQLGLKRLPDLKVNERRGRNRFPDDEFDDAFGAMDRRSNFGRSAPRSNFGGFDDRRGKRFDDRRRNSGRPPSFGRRRY
jgi:ATP-dependent RNA helicase MSS116